MKRFNLNGNYEFCPNGNYWQDVSGIFDKRLYLFCDCNKCNGQVYELTPVNITRKISKMSIERMRKDTLLDDIRFEINKENMLDVKDLLDQLKLR